MEHEPHTGIADGLSSCCTHAELRMGKPNRRDRKRQVRRHHRRFRKSHCGRDRNGTSQVCHEGWHDCTKRSEFRRGVTHTLGLSASLNAIDLEGPLWFKGGCSEDAGRSSAAVSIPDHLLRRSAPLLSAISGLMRCSKTAFLCGALWGFHNSRQTDRKGGPATRLALDRDVAAHHLTEAFTDREAK